MTHDINGLRARLFDTIDGLTTGKVTVEQARVISELAREITSTAKVEVDALRALGIEDKPKFLAIENENDGQGDTPALPNGITSIVRHRIT